MKTIIFLISLLSIQLFAFNSEVKSAFAIGIFDSDGTGENIQHTKETKRDYNGTCYTKVYIQGRRFNMLPKVMIGSSLGHFESSEPIFKNKIQIGEVLLFKHYAVDKGILKVFFRKKLFDSRVYVK